MVCCEASEARASAGRIWICDRSLPKRETCALDIAQAVVPQRRLAALGVTTAPSEPRRSVCAARDRGERGADA